MSSRSTREPPPGDPFGGERSLGELFRELSADSSRLLRQEIGLARTEVRQTVRALRRDLTRLGIGGAVAAVGLLTLLAFVVALLGDLLGDEYWLSALIVAVVLLGVGAAMAYSAVSDLRRRQVAPTETLQSLRATQRWAGQEVQEIRSVIGGNGTTGDGRGAVRTLEPTPPVPAARSAPPPTPAPGAAAAPRATDRPQGGLLKRVFHEIKEDDIAGQAAKVAYYTFLALPPTLMVIFSLTGIFGGPGAGDWIAAQLESAMPASAADLIDQFVQQVVHDNAPAPLSIGLVLALWAASGAFVGLMVTLNTAYDVEDDRSFIRKRLIAIGVLVAFILLFLVASVALVAGPQIGRALGAGGAGELIWNIVHWPLAFAFVVGAFWIVYYMLPNRDQSGCRKTLLKAAAGAAVLWLIATAGFRFYISNFGSYSETYGVLGGFIVLLLWLYVNGLVILAGGELASEMEEQA